MVWNNCSLVSSSSWTRLGRLCTNIGATKIKSVWKTRKKCACRWVSCVFVCVCVADASEEWALQQSDGVTVSKGDVILELQCLQDDCNY